MNTVVIKQKDKDLYAAIDMATERAKKVLRRHHDKIVTQKKRDPHSEVEHNESELVEDEIIPIELESYKPMEIEEALEELKDSEQQFFIFHDKEDKVRVIYKISENKYGLY